MEISKEELIKNLEEFNKKELVAELTKRGVEARERENKQQLLEKLADNILSESAAPEKAPAEAPAEAAPERRSGRTRRRKNDPVIAKQKADRRENIENLSRTMKEASEGKAAERGTGKDMELRPRRIRNAPTSLSVDGYGANINRQEEQDDFDLTESLNNPSVILTGTQTFAMENPEPWEKKRNPYTGEIQDYYQIAAVIQYNSCLVYIPAEYYLEDYFQANQRNVKSYIEERGGAEVDFRIIKIFRDGPEPIYIGSRIAALRKNRCDFWYSERAVGKSLLESGSVHEARVVAVSDGQLFVELFGVEARINARDITWNYVDSLKEKYSPGSTEFVKVKRATLASPKEAEELGYPVDCELSVKEAKKDPRLKFFKTNLQGMNFNGELRNTRVDENNVTWYYVETGKTDYEEGITIYCRLGDRISKIPRRGDRVSGKITFANDKQLRLFGTIYHVDPPIRRAGGR